MYRKVLSKLNDDNNKIPMSFEYVIIDSTSSLTQLHKWSFGDVSIENISCQENANTVNISVLLRTTFKNLQDKYNKYRGKGEHNTVPPVKFKGSMV